MIEQEDKDFIGAIPRDIFKQDGNFHIKGNFGQYDCKIRKGDIEIKGEDVVVGAYIDDHLLCLNVVNRAIPKDNSSTRNPEIYAKELILSAIVPRFLADGYELKGMRGDWANWSVNYKQYWESRENGMSKAKAARTTWTYQNICIPLGFTRIKSVTEDSRWHQVKVTFLRNNSK